MNEIAIKSKLLAEYLDWFYVPHNNLGDLPKAGWYKNVNILTKGAYNGRKYICRSHNDLRFYNSYDWLFEVVRKLEKEDLKDYFYKWEESGEMRYNFIEIGIDRFMGRWDVDINLELDPPITFFREGDTDLQQLFYSLCAAVECINKIKNETNL